jgi:4-amino-4-deoxychorismate lyase
LAILINGQQGSQLTVSDRGFQYGDGLFETVEVLNGRLIFIDRHLQRLVSGCEKLLLPVPDKQGLLSEALTLSQNTPHAVLKILLTRGSGGRGYKMPMPAQPTRVLSLHPFPDYPLIFQQLGVTVRWCQHRLGLNPALAGLKHLNRLEQILARAEWDDADIQEGLLLDLNGHLVEGTMSNVFFVKQNTLYTPDLSQAGVAGIMRDFVLQTAEKLGIPTVQGFLTAEELLEADEVFLTNSIIGIWPVKQIAAQPFSVGSLTQTFQAQLAQFKQQELAV